MVDETNTKNYLENSRQDDLVVSSLQAKCFWQARQASAPGPGQLVFRSAPDLLPAFKTTLVTKCSKNTLFC